MKEVSSASSRRQLASPKRGWQVSRSRPRRPRGTAALFVRRDAAGRETWYGKWWVGSSQVKRRIGPRRLPTTRDGLTRSQAEAQLRKPIGSVEVAQARRERMTIAEAGELMVANSTTRGLKRSTLMSCESAVRVHLAPFFGSRPLVCRKRGARRQVCLRRDGKRHAESVGRVGVWAWSVVASAAASRVGGE